MRSLKKQKLSLDSLIINGKSSEVTVFNMTIKLFNGACTNCAPMQLRTKGAYQRSVPTGTLPQEG